jgi:hypothetical protein
MQVTYNDDASGSTLLSRTSFTLTRDNETFLILTGYADICGKVRACSYCPQQFKNNYNLSFIFGNPSSEPNLFFNLSGNHV